MNDAGDTAQTLLMSGHRMEHGITPPSMKDLLIALLKGGWAWGLQWIFLICDW